jgi:hypothetical protein
LPLTLHERLRFGIQFGGALHLAYFAMFWLPSTRSVAARSVYARRATKRWLPADAVLIGTYSQPCPRSRFIEDLEAVIASERARNVQDAPDVALAIPVAA